MAFIMSWREDEDGADYDMGLLAGFRRELYCSLGMRRDALFDACDALACRPERVHMLGELSLEPECRRGHGGLYDALNRGDVVIGRPRRALSSLPLASWGDGRIRLPATCRTGCGRTRRPARSGCSATATRGGRAARR